MAFGWQRTKHTVKNLTIATGFTIVAAATGYGAFETLKETINAPEVNDRAVPEGFINPNQDSQTTISDKALAYGSLTFLLAVATLGAGYGAGNRIKRAGKHAFGYNNHLYRPSIK